MFNVGDLIIYSGHGVCHIDDICEKTYFDITRTYYVLHPLQDPNLTINNPVDNEKVVMLAIIERDEAKEILESFKFPGIKWIEKSNLRPHLYSDILKTGDRKEISKVANTLMKKKLEIEMNGKKFYECDRKLLINIQHLLFTELSISLNTTVEVINEKVISLINLNEA